MARYIKDARLRAVYVSFRGAHTAPSLNTPLGHAYRTGFLHPDIPHRYVPKSSAWAAWAAGVDDKRDLERASGLTYRPAAQPRLPFADN